MTTIYVSTVVYNLWYLIAKTALSIAIEYELADAESKINKAIMISLLTVDIVSAFLLLHILVKFYINSIISYNCINVFCSLIKTIYLISYIVVSSEYKAVLLLVASINDLLIICSAIFYHEFNYSKKIFKNNSDENLNIILNQYGKKIVEGIIVNVVHDQENQFKYHLEGFYRPESPRPINPHNQFYQQQYNQVEGQNVP